MSTRRLAASCLLGMVPLLLGSFFAEAVTFAAALGTNKGCGGVAAVVLHYLPGLLR